MPVLRDTMLAFSRWFFLAPTLITEALSSLGLSKTLINIFQGYSHIGKTPLVS